MQMQQKSNHWSENNLSPTINWISDTVFDFYKLLILRKLEMKFSEYLDLKFFRPMIWFLCIWIKIIFLQCLNGPILLTPGHKFNPASIPTLNQP